MTDLILQDNKIITKLDELTKGFTKDDIAMLMEILKNHEGEEIEVLQNLMGYTYRTIPVGVRQFIEDPNYLGLEGQIFPRLLDDMEELFEGDYVEAVLTGSIGWGKALGLDTKIPTPTGWTTMGDICVGDYVLSNNGKPCRVTNTTEVQHARPCYEVEFSDGETVIADAEHRWLASEWKDRAKASRYKTATLQKVVTTEEMSKSLLNGRMKNWAIELTKPIDLPSINLPIPPYVLGAWLGDGTSAEGVITCYDLEIIDKIKSYGYEVREHKATKNRFSILGLKVQLRKLGVLNNKYIPIEYLRSSIQQRTDLLCGLMDTDGNIEIGGRAEFTNMNKALTESVYELVASLGHKPVLSVGRATLKNRDCGEKYRVKFTPDTPIFCLSRKLQRQRVPGKQGSRNKRRYITSITPIPSVPVRCIEVDSPSHLFLFGRTFIATHNSTFAEIALCRMLYEISTLRDPQRAYGLMKGSVIVLLNVGVTRDNARKIVFQGVKNKLYASPYFVNNFPYLPITTELRFPNNIWVFPATGGDSGVIGYNVFGGVMDEVNFMATHVDGGKKAISTSSSTDQAEALQRSLIRRMKSRFMKKGKLPGILLQVSSSRYPDDYTERRMKEAEDDPTIFTRRYAQWDTLPKDRWVGKKFWISLGTGTEIPRILRDDNDIAYAEEKNLPTLEIPIEFYKDFDADIDAAIRDFAGRPTLTIHPYIRQRHKVVDALNKGAEIGLEHPFTAEVTTLQDGAGFIVEKLRIPALKKQLETLPKGQEYDRIEEEYKFLKSKPRFIHCDLSFAGDATGIAMGYVQGFKSVIKRNEEGKQFEQRLPIIVIDFMLRVVPPKGGEIQLADVRSLIYELRSYGYPIRKITFDQFQSKDSMQQFSRSGFDAGYLSIDRNIEVYNSYKDALYEDRLITYNYPILFEETIRLEKNERKEKVDHPVKGSKDVSDAVAGVCYNCVQYGVSIPAPPPTLGDMVSSGGQKPLTQAEKEEAVRNTVEILI